MDVKVPEDWTVVTKAIPLMGGIDDKTRPPQNADKVLVISGMVIMGGVAIKN
jgi:hypothetical protein